MKDMIDLFMDLYQIERSKRTVTIPEWAKEENLENIASLEEISRYGK